MGMVQPALRSRNPWHVWLAIGVLSFTLTCDALVALPRGGDIWDFGSFHLSGLAAARGADPYGTELVSAYAREFNVSLTAPNLNPPISIPLFERLSAAAPRAAFRIWWVLSCVVQLACVAWLVWTGPGRKLPRAVWGMSLGGFWMNLELGQIYAPLTALVAVAYHLSEQRPVAAGICAGLVAMWK